MNRIKIFKTFLFLILAILSACSSDDDPQKACSDLSQYLFQEQDSLILAEFEDAIFEGEDWKLVKSDQTTGSGYMVWQGDDFLGNPGNGLATFKLNINNVGTYRFIWNSAVTKGDNGTEHNDTWLRFADASDFYGKKNGQRVYPKGTGKSPNPNGSSKDGWFKIYRSGNDLDFKWQAKTSDNDGRDIYVVFDEPGTYLMEIAARSSWHGIDKFMLFQEEAYTEKEAVEITDFSTISCE
ncbi:hypothetical protein [Sediminitomix flava]|uniref:Heme-binding HmuY-like protein n=1 Tax=Sediminitomix flava TaxID=379075 RepID=A0A315Z690_SEDFL|nr:hypothetical protein [Sediminitomix flava]PWJ39174.1 hypothetical protein BC781_10675 [Sediminitomix flava]